MRDDQLARNSLVRPPDGWMSLRSADGRRAAREAAALLPRRARFLTTYFTHRLRALVGRSQMRGQL